MEHFLGTWKLLKKANYDKYLTAIGNVNDFNNGTITPFQTFYQDGDHFGVTIKNSHCTRDARFKLDEPFIEDTKDGRLCHSVVSRKGDQVVHVQKWDGKETTMVREVKDGHMIVKFEYNGVEAALFYERV